MRTQWAAVYRSCVDAAEMPLEEPSGETVEFQRQRVADVPEGPTLAERRTRADRTHSRFEKLVQAMCGDKGRGPGASTSP